MFWKSRSYNGSSTLVLCKYNIFFPYMAQVDNFFITYLMLLLLSFPRKLYSMKYCSYIKAIILCFIFLIITPVNVAFKMVDIVYFVNILDV